MVSKKTRTWIIDDKKYAFDSNQFIWLFDERKKETGKKVYELEEELAAAVCLTKDAIHNWRYTLNGPSDVSDITKIAEYFGVETNTLLKEIKEVIIMNGFLTEEQINDIKSFYCELIDYFDEFEWTEGFTLTFDEETGDQYFTPCFEEQEELFNALRTSLRKKRFSLHGYVIYDELSALLNEMETAYEEMVSEINDEKDLDYFDSKTSDALVIKWEERLNEIIRTNLYGECESSDAALTERQKKAFRTVYERIIEIIDDYEFSENYENYCKSYCKCYCKTANKI